VRGVIRRARKKDGRIFRAFRNEDDRVELYAVAHKNHYISAQVIPSAVGHFKLRKRFGRQGSLSKLLCNALHLDFCAKKKSSKTAKQNEQTTARSSDHANLSDQESDSAKLPAAD